MKITILNYKEVAKTFGITESNAKRLSSIVTDAYDYSTNGIFPAMLEIHIVDTHTEYSPEWTDPCPDYYGTFYIKWDFTDETICDGLDLDTLDYCMWAICDSFEQLRERK